ncbi:hypothetical protein D3C72_1671250 [compost metagenome]
MHLKPCRPACPHRLASRLSSTCRRPSSRWQIDYPPKYSIGAGCSQGCPIFTGIENRPAICGFTSGWNDGVVVVIGVHFNSQKPSKTENWCHSNCLSWFCGVCGGSAKKEMTQEYGQLSAHLRYMRDGGRDQVYLCDAYFLKLSLFVIGPSLKKFVRGGLSVNG